MKLRLTTLGRRGRGLETHLQSAGGDDTHPLPSTEYGDSGVARRILQDKDFPLEERTVRRRIIAITSEKSLSSDDAEEDPASSRKRCPPLVSRAESKAHDATATREESTEELATNQTR
ncbi:hypothetical protein G5I_13118 [Acromyrmex echinatior]|uniref:Uncharacterized protein n=1 Tax=Acromyrmex echinatior TaxID=103372 RepID=F4X460_ACREC|nr:hypothetical protein G5I_13118 [Acromyrmex echinatior]